MSDIADVTQEREERMMNDFLSKFRPQTLDLKLQLQSSAEIVLIVELRFR